MVDDLTLQRPMHIWSDDNVSQRQRFLALRSHLSQRTKPTWCWTKTDVSNDDCLLVLLTTAGVDKNV